jgi:ketosteroid isomerase-like protein
MQAASQRAYRIFGGLGMTSNSAGAVARSVGRGHWLLYVALALVGGLLTFVGARAEQKVIDDSVFRKLTDDYCTAWSSGNADAPAKFYAKANGLVFYDVAPFSYHSWAEYHDGVQKEFLDAANSIKLTAGKDLRVSRRGMIAWTTVPMHLVEIEKSGKTEEMDLRYTGIWEKHGANWLLVHEHISAPLSAN